MATQVYALKINVLDNFDAALLVEAQETCLGLPCSAPLELIFAQGKVSLVNKAYSNQKGVCVELESGVMNHRRLFGGGRQSEAVAKAVLGKMDKPVVFDATAGLARDSFICALFGAKVHMFERNPCVRILLKDGLRRAKQAKELEQIVTENLILEEAPTIFTYDKEQLPDTVYLDPMYPPRTKSASVKKEMATFHHLVGIDSDIDELWQKALNLAQKRVVMKNPKWAPKISVDRWTGAVETKNHRFDIYVPLKLKV